MKPSQNLNGGQYGQESEEGKEGENRSEEDCEEDPQGRQEEEVRHRLIKLPATLAGFVMKGTGDIRDERQSNVSPYDE